MPLSEWLRSWSSSDQPPERSDGDMVSDSLMMELDYQLRELEDSKKEKEMSERRAKGVVDYTWLATSTKPSYQMSQIERLELEQLCSKVKPTECGRVINIFRDALVLEPTLEEVPRLLRAAVLQVLESRPKEETAADWLTKSLTNLRRMRPRSSVRKVTPLCSEEEDLEMQRTTDSTVSTVSLSVYSSASSLPNFSVSSENMHV